MPGTQKPLFINPMTERSAADPFITYVEPYYYCLFTEVDRLTVYRSGSFAELLTRESKTVYTAGNEVKGCIWAPEMYRFGDRWYIYASGSTRGSDFDSIRMFCLESLTADPFGEYRFKAFTDRDIYAIDQSLYYDEVTGRLYIAYASVTPEHGNAVVIAAMDNPWTIGGERAMIGRAALEWELRQARVNEGPFFLRHGDKLFMFYSANDTASPHYAVGLLEHTGGPMVDPGSWIKHEKPVFASGGGICSVGHCSVFNSPDGSEYWLAYHGRTSPGSRHRQLFCRPFTFKGGLPVFGEPLTGEMPVPSGGL